MATYLGAFPFPSQAPAILTNDALLKVVTILTGRYEAVLRKGRETWVREIYRSLAVHDRTLRQKESRGGESPTERADGKGFAVDEAADDDEDGDDELVLSAFETLDAIEAFGHGERVDVHHSVIPSDNLLKLIELLILASPMGAQEKLSAITSELTDAKVSELRRTAGNILATFGVEQSHGVAFKTFHAVVITSLPYLFDGLRPLFEHFLFDKDFDLSKRKMSASLTSELSPSVSTLLSTPLSTPSESIIAEKPTPPEQEPALLEPGEILDLNTLSHLSFFLRPSPFRHVHPLYAGSRAGFSMGSFEKCVFKYPGPTILLLRGEVMSASEMASTGNPRLRTFTDSIPPSRLSSSIPTSSQSSTVTYGAYIPSPWKSTPSACFGDSSTVLFQLSPRHLLFPASTLSPHYVYCNKNPTTFPGIGFGSPAPVRSASHIHGVDRRHSYSERRTLPLGPVSLHLEDGLEFAVFTHDAEGGGSFLPSPIAGFSAHHAAAQPSARSLASWQDRIEITSLEVWGLSAAGDGTEAEEQRRAWKWEEREAERRRRINLGTGDRDADYELLKMAGLVSGEYSGGSM
ncbi:hypothetical protein P152DRAFT_456629 [Eremomyces bilateralis CBS 781.70]|uniref:Restriction of telomere capping protein 5 n=1 Tax=Eremomyces bilateralis CBS 781.70 TaxID=1392243 RepID=A0A6G1G940_9PEZI|nr:uncharacterized protein P152DRAFT_456629 [Eremomyces bilateralis CBS 781.70]KAF1814379.1 hypothetical protein P152DRAFT_456629 [Eremomyces bilateralis CBS 781.70]